MTMAVSGIVHIGIDAAGEQLVEGRVEWDAVEDTHADVIPREGRKVPQIKDEWMPQCDGLGQPGVLYQDLEDPVGALPGGGEPGFGGGPILHSLDHRRSSSLLPCCTEGKRRATPQSLMRGSRMAFHLQETQHVSYQVDVYTDEHTQQTRLEDDVRRGLTAPRKSLPPKYFYDRTGSMLFERITELPEYYPTRTEMGLLRRIAPNLTGSFFRGDIIEIGAGSSGKTRLVLDALNGNRRTVCYVPLDVDRLTLELSATRLLSDYPGLNVHAVVGDFERDLARVPSPSGRRLVMFLGSTIGNLDPPAGARFLAGISGLLRDRDDRFLLGVDLVKDRGRSWRRRTTTPPA